MPDQIVQSISILMIVSNHIYIWTHKYFRFTAISSLVIITYLQDILSKI